MPVTSKKHEIPLINSLLSSN